MSAVNGNTFFGSTCVCALTTIDSFQLLCTADTKLFARDDDDQSSKLALGQP